MISESVEAPKKTDLEKNLQKIGKWSFENVSFSQ